MILVTGAQGFIGSWLVSRLLADGERVAVLDHPAREGSRFALEGLGAHVSVARGELGDRSTLDGVDTVFHLAARPLVADAERDPAATYEVNVGGTWRLLESCASARVGRVILVSSYLGYGRGEVYREDMPLRPTSAYGTSNAAADLIACTYASRVPIGIVRLGNVYGGGDVHYSRLVPDAVRALAEGRRPVIRSDGTPQRDFLYVEDAVDACLAIAASLPGRSGDAWNAGAGEPVSILELVRTLVRVAGREDLEPDVQGAPTGTVDRQFLDTAKIRGALGWEPRHRLEEGLARTWEWYRARGGAAGHPAA